MEEAAPARGIDAEIRTTNQINDLMSLAIAEKNYIAQNSLQWFVSEQLEEVSTAETILAVIKPRRTERVDGRSLSGARRWQIGLRRIVARWLGFVFGSRLSASPSGTGVRRWTPATPPNS